MFKHINKFINDLSSNCLHPQILLPIEIGGNSKTIIDNMFFNIVEPHIKNVVTGNITFSISDQLLQFFFLPAFFLIIIPTIKLLKYMTRAGLTGTHF